MLLLLLRALFVHSPVPQSRNLSKPLRGRGRVCAHLHPTPVFHMNTRQAGAYRELIAKEERSDTQATTAASATASALLCSDCGSLFLPAPASLCAVCVCFVCV